MDLRAFQNQLTPEEGRRLKPYTDSVGKLTIGIGHNLSDNGISDAICDAIFKEDALAVINELNQALPWWQGMDEVRQRVLADLAFNMGIETLLTFGQFLGFMKSGSYSAAAQDLTHTKWASQVGARAPRLCSMLLTGKDPI